MARDICGFNTYLNVVPAIDVANATSVAGVLTLTHAATSRVRILVLTQSSKAIKAVLTKNWSREDISGDAQGDIRTALLARIATVPSNVHLILQTNKRSNTKFKFEFTDDVSPTPMTPVSGATEYDYAHANKRHWRVINDGTDWILDVDDGSGYVEEIRTADTRKIFTSQSAAISIVLTSEGSAGSESTKSEGSVVVAYDSSSDRPSAENAFAQKSLNGVSGVAGHQDYGGGADGGSGEGNPHQTNVDDWESGGSADDDTTFDRIAPASSGTTELQAYTVANYSPVNNQQAVKIVALHAAAVGGKFVTANLYTFDGTNIEHGPNAVPTASYELVQVLFRLAPDGNAWDSGDFDIVEIGHRTITDAFEDVESVHLTAILMEVVDIKNDAPAVTFIKPQVILY